VRIRDDDDEIVCTCGDDNRIVRVGGDDRIESCVHVIVECMGEV
jgi:hypothetical protein